MIRKPIRNSSSLKAVKPRVFDALIDGEKIYLEVKNHKTSEVIALDDVLYQIEAAKPQLNKPETTEP